eukprot:15005601-Ditylum_brightwellii.AAC.1
MEFNKGSRKGPRLIILHAITKDIPLCLRDNNGLPVDNLMWNGQTPHLQDDDLENPTAELLWLATSSSRDYHNNMNSDNFYQWVKNCLVPAFEKQYP